VARSRVVEPVSDRPCSYGLCCSLSSPNTSRLYRRGDRIIGIAELLAYRGADQFAGVFCSGGELCCRCNQQRCAQDSQDCLSHWLRQRRPPAPERPTGPTSDYSRPGAMRGASRHCRLPPKRWRPIWRPMQARRKLQPLAGVLPRSATVTSWRASPCRPMRRASRQPCAAFVEPMAAPGAGKPRGGWQDAGHGRDGAGQARWPAG
jgi:hypothetical protein